MTRVSAAANRFARRCASRPPSVLYTDVDGHCDKLVTDDRYQIITLTRASKLTVRETIDVAVAKFSKSRVWMNVLEGSTLIFGHIQTPLQHCRISRGKPLCPNEHDLYSRFRKMPVCGGN